jgi:hypothetical protein
MRKRQCEEGDGAIAYFLNVGSELHIHIADHLIIHYIISSDSLFIYDVSFTSFALPSLLPRRFFRPFRRANFLAL